MLVVVVVDDVVVDDVVVDDVVVDDVVGGIGSPVVRRTTLAGEVSVPKYIICVFGSMTADVSLSSPLSSTTQASCWLKLLGLMLILQTRPGVCWVP